MKKLIICAVLVATSGIAALSFNKSDDNSREKEIAAQKEYFSGDKAEVRLNDIGTAD